MAFPKIEIKWDWVSDVHVYIKSDGVILILTILSYENQLEIWELNYGPQMMWCKQTYRWNRVSPTAGGVNFIVCSCYFSARCFHAFYSIRSNFWKWFVARNMEPLSLRATSWGVLSGYDERACDRIIFS